MYYSIYIVDNKCVGGVIIIMVWWQLLENLQVLGYTAEKKYKIKGLGAGGSRYQLNMGWIVVAPSQSSILQL